jgi:hypothetical protein
MPMGKYPNFAACVAAQKKKGLSADSAKRYCGKIYHAVEGAKKEEINRLELKLGIARKEMEIMQCEYELFEESKPKKDEEEEESKKEEEEPMDTSSKPRSGPGRDDPSGGDNNKEGSYTVCEECGNASKTGGTGVQCYECDGKINFRGVTKSLEEEEEESKKKKLAKGKKSALVMKGKSSGNKDNEEG